MGYYKFRRSQINIIGIYVIMLSFHSLDSIMAIVHAAGELLQYHIAYDRNSIRKLAYPIVVRRNI